MPTGYTAVLQDKPDTTFEEFVWQCARAFGACIMQRDDSRDTPLLMAEEPSDYHSKAIDKAKADLAELEKMTPTEAEMRRQAEVVAEIKEKAESRARRAGYRATYEAMIFRAQAWEPPTPDHEGLRGFMIQQIVDSIKFDCGGTWSDEPPTAATQSAEAWLEERKERAQHDVDYHRREWAEECKRVCERNQWKRDLALSVPPPAKSKETTDG